MKSLIFLSTIIGVFTQAAPNSTVKPAEPKPKVIVQEIKPVSDIKKLLFPAQVQASMSSTCTADLDGHVKKILKTLGAPVKAGEIVLYLENQDPAFTYASVAVRSPVNGVLSQFNVQTMSKVAKGEKLFTVINADSLKINVEVPASEIGQLKMGQRGSFLFGGPDEIQLPVKILGVSPVIDPRSGTATAEIEFIKNDLAYKNFTPKVGIVGQVSFELSSGQIFLLPETSLSYLNGKPNVRVVDAKMKSKRREVILGEQRESNFVIKSGVVPGDKVVIRSNQSIKDNEEVEIQTPDAKEKN